MIEERDRRADAQSIREANKYTYFILLPDDWYKQLWDIIITSVLIFTFFATPYRIAFVDKDDEAMVAIDYTMDGLFFIDIILNFFIAYYDSDYVLIDKRKDIACHYLRTWFIIDMTAILPFNLMFETSDFGALARLTKIPRLYRLVRMFRMFRMLKIARRKGDFAKYFGKLASIGIGLERLVMLFVTFLLLCHIIACFWVIIQLFEEDQPDTWVYQNDFQDLDAGDLYIRAFYFTVTTITTVGFGDISPTTNIEMIFGVIVMISGVVAFSYATGALSSLLSNMDHNTAIMKQRIEVLDSIRDTYSIGPALYEELRQSVVYESSRDVSNQVEFVEKLPNRLKIELSVKIHREIVKNIPFFTNRERDFIAFIGPMLKPQRARENEYVFVENDIITKFYFLSKGICGFVLPQFQNVVYITIEKGDVFGLIDKFRDSGTIDKAITRHEFTIMALED